MKIVEHSRKYLINQAVCHRLLADPKGFFQGARQVMLDL